MSNWIARAENGNERECEDEEEAEKVKSDMEDLGMEVEIIAPDQAPFGYCEECGESIGHGAPSGSDRCRDCIKGPGTKCEKCGTDIPSDAPEDATLCEHHGSWALANPPETDGGAQTAADAIESAKTTVDTSNETNAPEADVVDKLPEKPPVDTDPLTWMPAEFTDTIDGTVAINRKGFSVLKQHYGIDTTSDCVVGPEETDFTFCRVKAVATNPDGTTSEAHGSAHVDRGDDPWLLLEMADTRAKKRALSDATGVGMLAVEELMNQP